MTTPITEHDARTYAVALNVYASDEAAGTPLPDDAVSMSADLADWVLAEPVRRRALVVALLATLTYLASVVVANYLTTTYGFIPVGLGQAATAGTFAAGGALVVRDLVQDAIGRLGVAALILMGALLSLLVAAPAIAVASMTAFAVAEAADFVLYTPLRKRGRYGSRWWATAVLAGAAVGAVLDTVLFLWIAFGWATVSGGLPGQLVAKGEVVLALIVIGWAARAVLREPLDTRRA